MGEQLKGSTVDQGREAREQGDIYASFSELHQDNLKLQVEILQASMVDSMKTSGTNNLSLLGIFQALCKIGMVLERIEATNLREGKNL